MKPSRASEPSDAGERTNPRLCACGCGQLTAIAKQAFSRYGIRRGEYRDYVTGHNLRGIGFTETHRQRIADGQRRAWKTRQRYRVGSKNFDAHGYVRVKVVEGYAPWPKEHTLVAEQMLGRKLANGEHVHHINGDRADNAQANLFVCDVAAHANAHGSFDRLLGGLIADGIVRFNRETGKYERC